METITRANLAEAIYAQVGLSRNESADLLFHYLILLQARGFTFNDIIEVLKNRKG